MLLRFCQADGFLSSQEFKKASQVRESHLVLSHAPLLSEESAGGALLFTVAVMEHCNPTGTLAEYQRRSFQVQFSPTWVVTLVSSGAHVFAFGGFGATGDGGEQDSEATVTRQLVEACRDQRAVRAVIAAPVSQSGMNKHAHWTASRGRSCHGDRSPGSGGGRS